MQKLKKNRSRFGRKVRIKSIILLIFKDFLQTSSFLKDIMNRSVKLTMNSESV